MSASQLRCQKQRCYDSRAVISFKDKAKSCQGTRIQKGESELLWVHLKRAEVQKQLVRVLLGGPCQQVFCKQDAQQTTMVQNTRLEEIGQNLAKHLLQTKHSVEAAGRFKASVEAAGRFKAADRRCFKAAANDGRFMVSS